MKAFILAAGLGSRLGEITKHTPKCLVNIAGKPLIEHVFERFAQIGVRSFVVNTFYLADQVETYLKTQESKYEITISREPELLGTGGAVKFASKYLRDSAFFLHNADIISEIDLLELKSQHESTKSYATLAVMKRETSRYLSFDENNQLCGWFNKDGSHMGEKKELLAFSGVQIVSPEMLTFFEKSTYPSSSITSYLKAALEGKKITAFRCDNSYWCDVGTLESLSAARKKYE